jgi:HSP20 family protein
MSRHRLQKRRRPFSHAELITPFDSLINELFNDSFSGLSKTFGDDFFVKGSYPKVNVLDLKDRVVIEAAIPGMTKEEVVVELKDDVLTLSGDKRQSDEYSDVSFVRRELKRSRFQRSFALGEHLNQDEITASCVDGILTLEIPKVEPDKDKKIARVIDIG